MFVANVSSYKSSSWVKKVHKKHYLSDKCYFVYELAWIEFQNVSLEKQNRFT